MRVSKEIELAKAHLRAFEEGNTDVFDWQCSDTFIYPYLPPVLGRGPVVPKRWHAILHAIYKTWSCEVIDAALADGQAILRVEWRASDPVDPTTTPQTFFDSCMFRFAFEDGLISCCEAVFIDHADRMAVKSPEAPVVN
jgi:hypothetical protein